MPLFRSKQDCCDVRVYVDEDRHNKEVLLTTKDVNNKLLAQHIFRDREIGHFANEVRKASDAVLGRFQTKLPGIGTQIFTPEEHLDVGEDRWFPATVCEHNQTQKKMVTIIPVGASPWFILSPWGNGPGIVAYLQDYNDEPVHGIEIVSHPKNLRSVDALVLEL